MKKFKRLYMRTHGFVRRMPPPWLPSDLAHWHRRGFEYSTDPVNMILEPVLFQLSWFEIIRRYHWRLLSKRTNVCNDSE